MQKNVRKENIFMHFPAYILEKKTTVDIKGDIQKNPAWSS